MLGQQFITTTDAALAAYVSINGYPPEEIEPLSSKHSAFRWSSKQEIQNLFETWEFGNPHAKEFYIAYRRLIIQANKEQKLVFGGEL
jgi:hypothetical protein